MKYFFSFRTLESHRTVGCASDIITSGRRERTVAVISGLSGAGSVFLRLVFFRRRMTRMYFTRQGPGTTTAITAAAAAAGAPQATATLLGCRSAPGERRSGRFFLLEAAATAAAVVAGRGGGQVSVRNIVIRIIDGRSRRGRWRR